MKLNIAVGIATLGRPHQLELTLRQLELQQRAPDEVFVCPATPADLGEAGAHSYKFPLRVVHGPAGAAAQRNHILRALPAADIVVFFDDDFYPAMSYLRRVEQIFARNSDVAVLTGWPALDGATGPGVTHEDAIKALETMDASDDDTYRLAPTFGAYGCNMAFRAQILREQQLLFDETLPLYSWLEDLDLSRRAGNFGLVVGCRELRGVHLATKRGRGNGTCLGYSQVVNPLYLMRKGSLTKDYALRQMARNVASNLLKSLTPEPWIDRRGRLKGNLLGLVDLMNGPPNPEGALRHR